MSYEIFYDRAFIRIPKKGTLSEDRFIPILCHGSNNCFDVVYGSRGTREVPEKDWDNWYYTRNGRGPILCTREQITAYAHEFSRPSSFGDLPFRARGRQFESEQAAMKWFDNGVRSAMTVENYTLLGNTVEVYFHYDKDGKVGTSWYTVRTNDEMLAMLALHLKENPRVRFRGRTVNKPKKAKAAKAPVEVDHFYVITIGEVLSEGGTYNLGMVAKVTSQRLKYSKHKSNAKKFTSEAKANKYMENLRNRYGYLRFKVDCINERTTI